MSLVDLQKTFVNGLNSESNDIFDNIIPSKKLTAKELFAIYQSSIVGNLQTALKDIYPICHKLVGTEFFYHLINSFIANNISLSYNLADFGSHFCFFVESFPAAKALAYLPDVIKLEWAVHKINFLPDESCFDFNALANIASYRQIYFSLPTASFLLTSPYPVHTIWEVNQDNFAGEQTIILEENMHYYLFIWRKQFATRIEILTYLEWAILQWIQHKFSLSKIIQHLTTEFPDANPSEILPSMIQRGWISSS